MPKDGRNTLIESGVTLIEVKGIHNKSLAIDNHTLNRGFFQLVVRQPPQRILPPRMFHQLYHLFKPMNTSTI